MLLSNEKIVNAKQTKEFNWINFYITISRNINQIRRKARETDAKQTRYINRVNFNV